MNTIKFKVSYEDLISRLPALFAYGEFNEVNEYVIHKATDSNNGCYGKIVENVIIPCSLVIDGIVLLKNDGVYSYKTLMNYYYQYKDDYSGDFFTFIENGIGKRVIQGFDRKIYDLVPEYIYIANAKQLYNEYVYIKKQCEVYKSSGGFNSDLCCLCDKFERMGGEKMMNVLKPFIQEAEQIAKTYYDKYVADIDRRLNICFNVCLTSSENDMGMMTPYVEEWVPGKKYYGGYENKTDKTYYGDRFYYEGNVYGVKNNQENKPFSGAWNDETLSIEFDDKNALIERCDVYKGFDSIVLEGTVDSKLKSLRRYKEYLNVFDQVETPDEGKDWLFYYRVGLVLNIKTLNDEFGNILAFEGGIPNGNNLYAYGDAITNISFNKDNNTITFEYILDAHLLAKLVKSDKDDDGNPIYKFENFRIDGDDKYHGVKYTETFTYVKNGELFNLIANNKFNDYVSGKYDGIDRIDKADLYGKYEFSTENSVLNYEKRINYTKTKIPYISSNFRTNVSNERDLQKVNLFRNDYYNGITFHPKKDIDVYINRGISAAFEKHIKFSEVKTLDDMVNYSNGSFFKMISDN